MNNIFSLKDKVIVITGGAGYLGRFMVKALLEFKGIVAVADIIDIPVVDDTTIPEEQKNEDEVI